MAASASSSELMERSEPKTSASATSGSLPASPSSPSSFFSDLSSLEDAELDLFFDFCFFFFLAAPMSLPLLDLDLLPFDDPAEDLRERAL